MLTATGTSGVINGEPNLKFNGTTLELIKNSGSPNIILSDTGTTTTDSYIRFEATSAGTPTYAFGVDRSDLNKFKMTYSTATAAAMANTEYYGLTTGGTFSVGSLEQITLTPLNDSSGIQLTNGSTSPPLNTQLNQFSTFALLAVNAGSSVANEDFYIINESVSGVTVFRTNTSDDTMYLYPTTNPQINGDGGVRILGNFATDGTVAVGTVSGSGVAVYRNATTGILSTTSSDIRLKQNITQITGSTNIIKNLNGVYFNWKDNEDFKSGDESRQLGLIAQEVEQHLPEAVTLNGNKDYKTVRYSELVSVLIEGFKEQQNEIELLKTEIQNLKNRLDNSGL